MRRAPHVLGVLVAVLLTVACTPKSDRPQGGTESSAPASPVPGRLAGTCEELSGDSLLSRFAHPDDEDEFPNDGRIADDITDCGFNDPVSEPLKGELVVTIKAKLIDPEEDRTGWRSPDPICSSTARCWLGSPKDCTVEEEDPPDTDFRVFNAGGEVPPYEVEIHVGLWPDDRAELCRADKWSKAQAIRLLNKTLKYLSRK